MAGRLPEASDEAQSIALGLSLDADDLSRMQAAPCRRRSPAARYDPTQLAHLDSEAHR